MLPNTCDDAASIDIQTHKRECVLRKVRNEDDSLGLLIWPFSEQTHTSGAWHGSIFITLASKQFTRV